MRDFRTLKAWQRSHQFVLSTYKLSSTFPKEELFGLTSQLRRAAVSVPSNIAEGCGTYGGPDFARFLQFAMRSASELDYQLLLSRDLNYIAHEEYLPLADELTEIRRILNGLIQKVRSEPRTIRRPGTP